MFRNASKAFIMLVTVLPKPMLPSVAKFRAVQYTTLLVGFDYGLAISEPIEEAEPRWTTNFEKHLTSAIES
jgi:hypothetical protein